MHTVAAIFFACLIVFWAWYITSGKDNEDYSDDPYLTYGYLVSPMNTLAWWFISVAVPLSAGAVIWFVYDWSMALYGICLLLPLTSWVCLKLTRRTTRLPIEIVAALVWLERFRTTKRIASFVRTARGVGLFAEAHWTEVAVGLDEANLLVNFDHRSYLLPWNCGMRLSETQIKSPGSNARQTALAIEFPVDVEVRLLAPCTTEDILFALDCVFQSQAGLLEGS